MQLQSQLPRFILLPVILAMVMLGSGSTGLKAEREEVNCATGFTAGVSACASDVFGVAIGRGNTVLAHSSSALGGESNKVTETGLFGSILGGRGSTVSGMDSAAIAGNGGLAGADRTIVIGTAPSATHPGAILIAAPAADSTGNYRKFESIRDDEFAVQAVGGVRLVTAVKSDGSPAVTVTLGSDGRWTCQGERCAENDLRAKVDAQEQRIARLEQLLNRTAP